MSGVVQSDEERRKHDGYTVRTKNTFLDIALPPHGESDEEFAVPHRRQVSAPASCSGSTVKPSDESGELMSAELRNGEEVQERRSDASPVPDDSPLDKDEEDDLTDSVVGSLSEGVTPSQASDRGGRRRRPNKSKRARFKAFANRVEALCREDPENFSWEELNIPASIGVDSVYTPKLRARLEGLASEMMSADAGQSWTRSGGATSSSSSVRTATVQGLHGGSREELLEAMQVLQQRMEEVGQGDAEEARRPESVQALDPIKDDSPSSKSSKSQSSSPGRPTKMSL